MQKLHKEHGFTGFMLTFVRNYQTMQILLSCAKDMTSERLYDSRKGTIPMFQQQAEAIATQMMSYSAEELGAMLKINHQLAALNKHRYTTFLEPEPKMETIFSYTGIAYKYLQAGSFSDVELAYAQGHLWITSFLYGLLRPLDMIKNYRLEGSVYLGENGGQRMFDYWKPLLTDVLIDSVKQDDGVLLNVASAEMKHLFDWKRVKREVKVIEPEFMVDKNGKLKSIVVYCKMCRGAMANDVIRHQIKDPDQLKNFEFEGFSYRYDSEDGLHPLFVMEG
ncbi:YaaA family protein [Prevotella sp. DNF00663]|uniref:YaaA family protein n=1 Tax=Prevotella sp. DNF00663 TaxID=1384078 RepID=UPI00350F7D80